jgi:4a-hydroxytetrahydrobiopterin dehydratase
VGEAGDALGHHPRVSIGKGYVDFKLVSDDAIYRDDEGTEHVVEWVTQQDVDLARRITAAVAAGGTVVDDSDAPSLTVIADQDGNKGIVCVDASAAKKD